MRREMPLKSLRAWLGVDRSRTADLAPLRETLDALDHLEPDRARYLAAFAYLLGRLAHADQHVSPEETQAMETLVRDHGRLSQEQAMVVVQLAKSSKLLFGGTADFLVAREFSALATYDEKLALMRCLFALGAADNISVVIRATVLQLMTPNSMRGRVSAVSVIFIGTSNEIGELESGVAAQWLGVVPAVTLGGVMTLVTVAAVAAIWPELRVIPWD